MLANKLMGGSADKLYVDDVFSTFLYTGNGSAQTINNGIDLAGEGGMVWRKNRSGSASFPMHQLSDTVRGVQSYLISELTQQATNNLSGYEITSFDNNGFTLGLDNGLNQAGVTYASWTFRKAPKFFDVVTYTGNGVAGRQIPHGLGIAPGMITTKSTSTTGDWNTYHRSATGDLELNLDIPQTASKSLVTAASDSTFTVSGVANTNGVQYVAYLFAHDPSEDGLIQCGVTTANTPVDLGWEPQYLLFKNAANAYESWIIYDSMRGLRVGGYNPLLYANASNAENTYRIVSPSATGFTVDGALFYLAIRRPNKPPTSGTEVYKGIAQLGGGVVSTGFPVDATINIFRSGNSVYTVDRLRGARRYLQTNSVNAEGDLPNDTQLFDQMGGFKDANFFGANMSYHAFRRAPKFFDIVCYTGTGVARTVPHGLGVAPELMIVKKRSSATNGNWICYTAPRGNSEAMYLDLPNQSFAAAVWDNTTPTATVFSLSNNDFVNGSGATYVAYLFATLPGISKVGSYTGNGTSQAIPCGFTTGARFVLIKRTDSTGDWMIADTARGIVAAADPRLSLNTTAAEVTGEDWLDPDPTGFIVNQVAGSNANVSGASYIFLAIA